MNRDTRSVAEQVKSGFRIVGKMLAAFAIAATFMAGCSLIQMQRHTSEKALGWVLITTSISLMTTTVKFWAAGFVGFIAYGAWRLLTVIFFAEAFHVSRLHALVVTASVFAMVALAYRFTNNRVLLTFVDRISIVIAACCVLLTFLFADSYRGLVVFNVGNLSLLLSWWINRASKRNRHKRHARHAAPVINA